MVPPDQFQAVVAASMNLNIPYEKAQSLVEDWHRDHPIYDWRTLAQWILVGDVVYTGDRLKLDTYTAPEELEKIVALMRGENGLSIKDRRHMFKTYPKCFIGKEAVQWLMDFLGLKHDKAVRVGQRLLEWGVIHHVGDEHEFKDAYLFYRFYADESKMASE